MEDFRLDIMIDQGPNARSVRLSIPRFTLIGATTRAGLLTAPLRSRFTLQTRLDYYDIPTLMGIVTRSCGLLNVAIDEGGALEIATRSRGTPRIANNLINFCRDYAQERAKGKITQPVAASALELWRSMPPASTRWTSAFSASWRKTTKAAPSASAPSRSPSAKKPRHLKRFHEPFLIQEGYLQRTPQGRVLTDKGYHAIGLKAALGGNSA
jgi:Holliday junction DNA helicase RuvB